MALTSRARNVLQWRIQRAARPQGGANLIKMRPSSDRGLQLDPVKAELLVIADQHAAVNTFPGLVHRPSHHGSRQYPKSARPTSLEEAVGEGRACDWGEVVTR